MELILNHNNLGKNPENLRLLGEIIKNLPNILHNLELHLSSNDLGGNNAENLIYLAEALKNLPNNLKNIDLILNWNNLGENPENLKYLG